MIKIGMAQFNTPKKSVVLMNLYKYLDENNIKYRED